MAVTQIAIDTPTTDLGDLINLYYYAGNKVNFQAYSICKGNYLQVCPPYRDLNRYHAGSILIGSLNRYERL